MPNKAEWEMIFVDQQSSGLSQKQYCELKGLNYRNFQCTKSKYKHQSSEPTQLSLCPVSVQSETRNITFTLDGHHLEFSNDVDDHTLTRIIKAFRSS